MYPTTASEVDPLDTLPRETGGSPEWAPAYPTEEVPQSFTALFKPLPAGRVASGYLELGQWLGDEYEQEIQVELCLGPDGQVWARVGSLEAIPQLPLEEREQLARRILAEFIDAYADWSPGERLHPTPQTLRSWPAWQLTTWLLETAPHAPAVLARLMDGVLAEIEALGFQVAPVGQE